MHQPAWKPAGTNIFCLHAISLYEQLLSLIHQCPPLVEDKNYSDNFRGMCYNVLQLKYSGYFLNLAHLKCNRLQIRLVKR